MKMRNRLTAFASLSVIVLSALKVLAGAGGSPATAVGGSNSQAPSSAAAGEQLKWQVVSGGGNQGANSSYILAGTIGQTAAGLGISGSYKLNQGYWQNFSVACLCGDANGSGSFSISDVVRIINYIFSGGPAPNPLCLGDANGSGAISISDAVRLINYIFGGGPAPHC